MNRNLLRFELRLNRPVLIGCGLGLFLFQFLMVAFYLAARPDQYLTGVYKILPQAVKTLFGAEFLNPLEISGFLAFAFTHPFNLLLLCTSVVVPASRIATGRGEHASADLILSQPLSRRSVILSRMGAASAGAALMAACLWAGHYAGTAILPVETAPPRLPFLLVALNALLFLLAVQGAAFLIAAGARLRGTAVGLTIALLALMLFLRMAGEFWKPFEIPALASFLTYYVPARTVAAAALPLRDAAALAGIFLATSLAALVLFDRRDV